MLREAILSVMHSAGLDLDLSKPYRDAQPPPPPGFGTPQVMHEGFEEEEEGEGDSTRHAPALAWTAPVCETCIVPYIQCTLTTDHIVAVCILSCTV